MQPIDMAVGPDRTLYVLDHELQRVVVFDSAGAHRLTFPVPGGRALSMHLVRDELWFGRYQVAAPDYMVLVTDLSGREIRQLIMPTEREFQYALHGEPGTLTALSGTPALAVIPATWITYNESGELVRRGVDMVDGRGGYAVDRRGSPMMMTPGGPRGVLELARRRVAYIHFRRLGRAPEAGVENRIAVLDEKGHLLAEGVLPFPDKFRNPAVSGDGTRIYLGVHDPFPRVIEFRVVIGSELVR